MFRLSTVAVSTLVPALKVRSTTLPERTFFRVVRTNAPPLPGLTCRNSTTVHSSPSRLRTMPFFRSLVVAIPLEVSFSVLSSTCGGQTRSSLPDRYLRAQVPGHRQPGRICRRLPAGGETVQGQPVPLHPQATDHPGGDRGDHRVVPELLPGVDVGQVHLNQGCPQQGAGVSDRVRVVRPRRGVQYYRRGLVRGGVQPPDQLG